MTTRYVGPGGSNANDGLTWATRKLTLNGVEDTPVVAGDIVYVGPGSYRETLTLDVSGGNAYSTGTVSLTNGSAVVTGSGSAWLANVAADYIFHVTVLAHGTDGVTTAVTATSHTFTSAAGNFQAGHVGRTIRIGTIGAYIITAVGGPTSITIAKPDNSSFLMSAGTGLTYDVGPEVPYDILSVDSDTQITLSKPWGGPSFTGLAYLTYNPIRYIGDYTGANTDGVGGVVRVTGSADDIALTRANCITGTSRNYRTFQGFQLDLASGFLADIITSTDVIFDKCIFFYGGTACVRSSGLTQARLTVRNCAFFSSRAVSGILFIHSSVVDNSAHLVENCLFVCGASTAGVLHTRVGGTTVKNSTFWSGGQGVQIATAITVGQTVTVNNCVFQAMTTALAATVAGEIVENYNAFFGNNADRINTNTGANSLAYPALFDPRWFFQMTHEGAGPNSATQVVTPFDLASFSALLNLAGTSPTTTDMRGTPVQGAQREWGALEYDSTLKIESAAAGGGGVATPMFGGGVVQ